MVVGLVLYTFFSLLKIFLTRPPSFLSKPFLATTAAGSDFDVVNFILAMYLIIL